MSFSFIAYAREDKAFVVRLDQGSKHRIDRLGRLADIPPSAR